MNYAISPSEGSPLDTRIDVESRWRLILQDKKLLRRFYRRFISITLWLGGNRHGFDDLVPESLRCPFHADTRPSARLYRSDTKGDVIYCFGCSRNYDSYDYVELLLQKSPREWVQTNFLKDDLMNAVSDFGGGEIIGAGKRKYDYKGDSPQEAVKNYYGSQGAEIVLHSDTSSADG